jgi:hypothetical protein
MDFRGEVTPGQGSGLRGEPLRTISEGSHTHAVAALAACRLSISAVTSFAG